MGKQGSQTKPWHPEIRSTSKGTCRKQEETRRRGPCAQHASVPTTALHARHSPHGHRGPPPYGEGHRGWEVPAPEAEELGPSQGSAPTPIAEWPWTSPSTSLGLGSRAVR